MASSLFNIGVSGLRANQSALNVIGQNITNASTPGYSRQRAEITTQTGINADGLAQGAGARVDRITRITDEFANKQILSDTSLHTELDAFTQRIQQLEGTLFDGEFGIDAALRDFFGAMQNASNEPSDIAMRQFVLANAESLISRFQGVTDRASLQARDVISTLESATNEVNELAGLIVQLNERLSGLQSEQSSGSRNALLDRRDILLKDLSGLVSVSFSETPDGQINVFVGKGQPLVLGAEAAEMGVTGDGDIVMRPVGHQEAQIVTRSISGGELGGILKYQADVLWPTQAEVGRLAATIAMAINEQHHLGVDLQGRFGADFFRDINDPDLIDKRVAYLGASGVNGSQTSPPGTVNVYIEDPFTGEASDYEVLFSELNPGSYSITRRSDGEVVFNGNALVVPQEIEFDGLRVEFAAGEFKPGQRLLLRPYADFGAQLSVALQDPSELALASPVLIGSDPNNQGSATATVAGITDPQHPLFADENVLMPPLLVRFVSADQYQILDNADPARPVPLQPDLGLLNYAAGSANHVLPHEVGTTVVSASGPAIGALPAVASLVNNLDVGNNGYPPGSITLAYSESNGSVPPLSKTVTLGANASAREIAEQLNTLPGTRASANTRLELSNLVNLESGTPVALAVNGELLEGFSDLNDLADAISGNEALASQGIVARSDGQTLVLESLYGDDLTLHFQGDPNESVLVTNTKGDSVALGGNVLGTYRSVTVGGTIATLLEPDVSMTAQFDGVFAANPVHERADLGFDLVLAGSVVKGDEFYIDFNDGSIADNRNALALAALNDKNFIGQPARTFAGAFGTMIQEIGIASSQANINKEAAAALLEQAEAFRESISGVNLDEEAANLIKFEQAYNASAQLISVARDIFNILLNSVS